MSLACWQFSDSLSFRISKTIVLSFGSSKKCRKTTKFCQKREKKMFSDAFVVKLAHFSMSRKNNFIAIMRQTFRQFWWRFAGRNYSDKEPDGKLKSSPNERLISCSKAQNVRNKRSPSGWVKTITLSWLLCGAEKDNRDWIFAENKSCMASINHLHSAFEFRHTKSSQTKPSRFLDTKHKRLATNYWRIQMSRKFGVDALRLQPMNPEVESVLSIRQNTHGWDVPSGGSIE